jgi:hypothetical protein
MSGGHIEMLEQPGLEELIEFVRMLHHRGVATLIEPEKL